METPEKQVARRFYDAFTSGRLDDFDAVLAPDLRGHAGAGANVAEFKANVAGFTEPFPDLQAQIRHLVQEGELVSTWVTFTATHQHTFAGVPGSGRPIRFAAWDLMRIRDGRIVELTEYCDLFTILSQIGALPTAAPA
jgi:steroid delta-isomerase-like uncharacterized protein